MCKETGTSSRLRELESKTVSERRCLEEILDCAFYRRKLLPCKGIEVKRPEQVPACGNWNQKQSRNADAWKKF